MPSGLRAAESASTWPMVFSRRGNRGPVAQLCIIESISPLRIHRGLGAMGGSSGRPGDLRPGFRSKWKLLLFGDVLLADLLKVLLNVGLQILGHFVAIDLAA